MVRWDILCDPGSKFTSFTDGHPGLDFRVSGQWIE